MTTLSESLSETKRAELMNSWGVLRAQVLAIAPRLAEQMPSVKVQVFRQPGSSGATEAPKGMRGRNPSKERAERV
jgi:hypothetical protein